MTNTVSFPGLGIDEFTLNRVAITVFGKEIYWYGILIAVGFLLAFIYVMKKIDSLGITSDDLIDCLIFGVIAAIVGARILYVATYQNSDGVNIYFDGENDFVDIISIWNGGLAIYGGLILCVIVTYFVTRHKKIPLMPVLDAAALGLPLGQAIGRWGNFINCEAYGTETETALFRMSINGEATVHPAFLYESVWNIFVFIIVNTVSRKNRRLYDGQLFVIYIALYGLGRGIIEVIRTDALYIGSVRISGAIAFACVAFGIFMFAYMRLVKKPDREKLYVNRLARQAVEAAEAEAEAVADDDMMDEKTDELSETEEFESSEDNSWDDEPSGDDEDEETL